MISDCLALRDGVLRLGVVADTHSKPDARGLEALSARAPHAILHAGDVGALGVLDVLDRVAPTLAVRGNIDEHTGLPEVRRIDVVDDGATLATLLLLHVAVNGPRLRADAARLAEREDASLVVCGHSHVPFLGRDRGRVVFNPGSMGPRRFQLPIVFGWIEVTRAGVDVHHVDCATGQRWTP